MNSKDKVYILFWKTKDRWQIARGVDIAGAANNAPFFSPSETE